MRIIVISVLLFFFIQSIHAQSAKEASAKFEKIQWLVGQWNRTNAKPGRSGIEEWEKISSSVLQGRGVNMKGQDTAFIEKLRIILKDNELYYVADVPENNSVVYFKCVKLTEDEFICENQAHDFPKVIAYKREGSKLKATISGSGKSIDYLFERK
jgi:hypothetical protein